MRKKILAAWAKTAGILVVIGITAVLSKSPVIALTALCIPLLALVSAIINIFISKKIILSFVCPPTASKSSACLVTLNADNGAKLPAGKLMCTVIVQNSLTGEVREVFLEAPVNPLSRSTASFMLQSEHCGFMVARVKKAYITDWPGLFLKRIESDARGEMSILPDTFVPVINITVPPVTPFDDDSYSPDKKGYDLSEVFQLREYTEQDSLRQVHWKLSGKLDKLIVRDGSLPVAKSILVFWDRNARSVTPAEADAMAEVFCSVCQVLSDMGVRYTLGYSTPEGCVMEEVDDTEDLLGIIPSMFKDGCGSDGPSGVQLYTERYGRALYGKVICLCASIPPGLEEFASGNLTLITLDGEASPDDSVICITPENYAEELTTMEL
ncbi:MAG: DUF58 domain-containing protein [Eubacteriaceae bacterium]|nr:DUF58 domain-containing protein [Eubacteriaceae bacterium]